MAEKQIEKTEKVEDGKGIPPAAEPPPVRDLRLFPGGSPKGAALRVGINADVPGVQSTS